jgi:hypothetical protein
LVCVFFPFNKITHQLLQKKKKKKKKKRKRKRKRMDVKHLSTLTMLVRETPLPL